MSKKSCLSVWLWVSLLVCPPAFLCLDGAANNAYAGDLEIAGSDISIDGPEGSVDISGGNVDINGPEGRVTTSSGKANVKSSSVKTKRSGHSRGASKRSHDAEISAGDGQGSHVKIGRGGIEIVTPDGSVIIKTGQTIGNFKRQKRIRVNQSEPLKYEYKDNRDVVIKDRYIDTDLNGLSLGGNSDVLIKNCYIEAGNVAINAWGNTDVKIVGCTIIGEKAAVIAKGNSTVSIKDSFVVGKLSPSGNGDIEDEGNNDFE